MPAAAAGQQTCPQRFVLKASVSLPWRDMASCLASLQHVSRPIPCRDRRLQPKPKSVWGQCLDTSAWGHPYKCYLASGKREHALVNYIFILKSRVHMYWSMCFCSRLYFCACLFDLSTHVSTNPYSSTTISTPKPRQKH